MRIFDLIRKAVQYENPLRPPGALDEEEFNSTCIRCRKCEEICIDKAIRMADYSYGSKSGTPIIIARESPCLVCDDLPCIEVCPTEALAPVASKREINMGLAVIDESICFAFNGIICRACYERCPIYGEAITLEQELFPKVHEDACIGCGICVKVCPVVPVAVKMISRHKVLI